MNDDHEGGPSRGARAWALPVLLLAALLLVSPHGAAAAEAAGRLVSAVGEVRAIDADGVERLLERGDEVQVGDTVVVGSRSTAQLRMRDQALIDLEAESRFRIERYEYRDGDNDSAVMRFLRGALRTVTGAIGKKPDDTYRMETPVATIGVRGTQYALQLCDVRCAREDRPPGLYGRVDEGVISVTNRAASKLFERNEYFHVADRDVAPREIVSPPEGILDGGAVAAGDLQGLDGDLALEGDLLAGDDSLLSLGGGLLENGGELVDTTLTNTLITTGNLLDNGGEVVGSTLEGDVTGAAGDLMGTTDDLLNDGGNLVEDSVSGVEETSDDLIDDTTGILLDEEGNLLGL